MLRYHWWKLRLSTLKFLEKKGGWLSSAGQEPKALMDSIGWVHGWVPTLGLIDYIGRYHQRHPQKSAGLFSLLLLHCGGIFDLLIV